VGDKDDARRTHSTLFLGEADLTIKGNLLAEKAFD
jgi:hypothetical protein